MQRIHIRCVYRRTIAGYDNAIQVAVLANVSGSKLNGRRGNAGYIIDVVRVHKSNAPVGGVLPLVGKAAACGANCGAKMNR